MTDRTISSFDEALAQVRWRMEEAFTSGGPILRGYMDHLSKSQGKGLRATTLLACALGPDGRIPEDAINFAAGIELLHAATLIHDDVIDDADLRRGEASMQKRFGKRAAVICGDWLLATALRTAAGVRERETYLRFSLPDYVSRVCLGELKQHMNNGNLALSIFHYLRIISGKTAALFEASCYAGAIFTTAEEDRLRLFRRLGWQIGMIFQLMDDCMDYEADRAAARKPVQSDFEQGVITLPLICALQKEPSFRRDLMSGSLSRAQLGDRVRRAGGLESARRYAGRYHSKAKIILARLSLPPAQHALLLGILDTAYQGVTPAPKQNKEK